MAAGEIIGRGLMEGVSLPRGMEERHRVVGGIIKAAAVQIEMGDTQKPMAERYTPLELEIAKILLADTQNNIKAIFGEYQRLVRGEGDMFSEGRKYSRSEAVKEVFKVDDVRNQKDKGHGTDNGREAGVADAGGEERGGGGRADGEPGERRGAEGERGAVEEAPREGGEGVEGGKPDADEGGTDGGGRGGAVVSVDKLIDELVAADDKERAAAGTEGYNEAFNEKAALADRVLEAAPTMTQEELLKIYKVAQERGMHAVEAHVESELLRRRDAQGGAGDGGRGDGVVPSSAAKTYDNLKSKYPDRTLLLRVGDYYYVYGEDAKRVSEALGTPLLKENGIDKTAVKYEDADAALQKLVGAGMKVGISDNSTDVQSYKAEEAGAPTKEQKALVRGLSELMQAAGIGTHYKESERAEMQRILDAYYEQVEKMTAAESKRRKERDEINRTIEGAMSIVTGKDKKTIRKERIEREEERRRTAQEVYRIILTSEYNDVSLQKIKDFIDDVTPRNPYGRRLSERLPQRVERALYERERSCAIDALFSRASESAVPANERAGASGKRAVEAKKRELIERWAKATGNWHTDLKDFTDNTEAVSEDTTDSDVYMSNDGQHVIKLSRGKRDKRFGSDIDAVPLFNYVFPNSAYKILGYGDFGKGFVRVLEQSYVDFKSSKPLSAEERTEYMAKIGFEPINKERTAFSNGEIVVADLQGNNIVRDAAGNVRVIDADCKLHTKDVGGKYEYLPVEHDMPMNGDRMSLMKGYHGSGADFEAFDHSHMGEGEGAQAYGWGHYVTEVEGIGKTYAKEIGAKRKNEAYTQYSNAKTAALRAVWNYQHAESNEEKKKAAAEYKRLQSEADRLYDKWQAIEEERVLYTVEIPDDNGSNYLEWDGEIKREQLSRIAAQLTKEKGKEYASYIREKKDSYGENIYYELYTAFGSQKEASEFLHNAGFVGIKYPAEFRSGGREDGAKNYVVFNDNDLKITDKYKFFKGADGEVLGFTKGGEVFIDPRKAKPDTPVHEYTHLWADGLERRNAEAFGRLTERMRTVEDGRLWEYVKGKYPEIEDEKELVKEVFAHYSGKRGGERLEAEMREEMAKAGDMVERAKVANVFHRLRELLTEFWSMARDLFAGKVEGIEKLSAEDFADMALNDLLRGFDPRGEGGKPKSAAEEKTLMGVHNISEEKLRKALKSGGLANPSMAVIDTRNGGFDSYGDISLIPRASLIDAKTGRNAGTYSGDAWTATYPGVSTLITDQGRKNIKRIAEEASEGNNAMRSRIESKLQEFIEGNSDRLHYLFLQQTGRNPEILGEKTQHTHEEYEALEKIFGKGVKWVDSRLTDEQHDALLKVMMADIEEEATRKASTISDPEQRERARKAVIDMYKKSLLDEGGKMWFAKWNNYVSGVLRDENRRQNPSIDYYGTDLAARDRVRDEGLQKEYEQWKANLLDEGDKEEKLFAGYTPSGYRRYVPNTVENASKLMNKHGDVNVYGSKGLNATRATLLKRMRSLADIRKHRELLKGEDEYNESQKMMSDELFDIINQISDLQKISDNQFSNIDYAEARLQEALTERDPIEYLNREYGYHIDKGGDLASQIMNFIEKAKNMPAKYFETKFKRPVSLEEFAVAVVPEGTSAEVVEALRDAGLDVRTYDGTPENREAVTLEAVRGRDDIRFQKAEAEGEIKEMSDRLSQWLSDENIGKAKGKSRDEIIAMFGNEPQPIAMVPDRFLQYIGDNITDSHVYSGMGYFIDHAVNHHPTVDAKKYQNIQAVLNNPDEVKSIKDNGHDSIVFIKQIDRYNAVVIEVEKTKDGKIIWHKSFYDQKKKPYANKGVQLYDASSGGGVSPIIRTDKPAHDGSLSVLDDGAKIQRNSDIAKNNLQEAEGEGEKSGVYTTRNGVQLSMESLFEDNPTDVRLRKLSKGETCYVERRYEESRQFSFTGKEKIESMDDVAYIFKQLETAAVENTFIAMLKDGKPTVIHIGMGGYSSSPADAKQALAAYMDMKPDAVYFVHNHPSGSLRASRDDMNTWQVMREIFGDKVFREGIIIDTVSGKYCTFGYDGNKEAMMPKGDGGDVPVRTYEFSKQVFSPEWNPQEAFKMTDSGQVAKFVSAHRLGKHKKMSLIVTNTQGQVVGNFFLPWTKLSDIGNEKEAAREMSNYVNLAGGVRGILYGNYEYDRNTDENILMRLSDGMKTMGTSLLDVIHLHGENDYHSAMETGAMEPTSDYEMRVGDGGTQDGEKADEMIDEVWKDRTLGLHERVAVSLARLAANNEADAQTKRNAARALAKNLAGLRKAMSMQRDFDKGTAQDDSRKLVGRAMRTQKGFDKGTVKRVSDLARIMVQYGYLDGLGKDDVKRLLSAVKNATGKEDVRDSVEAVMDVMIESQLRRSENDLGRMLSVRATKVDVRGVQMQGALDATGQQKIKAFRDWRNAEDKAFEEYKTRVEERMGSDDDAVAAEAKHCAEQEWTYRAYSLTRNGVF